MKLLICFLLLSASAFAGTKDSVYVCTGSMAYAYHKSLTCKGLDKCTKEVRKESRADAIKEKRSACKVCRP